MLLILLISCLQTLHSTRSIVWCIQKHMLWLSHTKYSKNVKEHIMAIIGYLYLADYGSTDYRSTDHMILCSTVTRTMLLIDSIIVTDYSCLLQLHIAITCSYCSSLSYYFPVVVNRQAKLGRVGRHYTHQAWYANLLSQLTTGTYTVSLVIMHDFSGEVPVQTSTTIHNGDRCTLNKGHLCFNFTVCYYSREILCRLLDLCKCTERCTHTLTINNRPTMVII